MEILVIDGQGGGMGRGIVTELRKRFPQANIRAVGTNSVATGTRAALSTAPPERMWKRSRSF